MKNMYETVRNTAYVALATTALSLAASSCQPHYETIGFCEKQNLSDSSALEKTLDVDSTKLSESKKSGTTSYAFKE